MGRVAHHLLPGQRQQSSRPGRRVLEQCGKGLCSPLQLACSQTAQPLDVDPVGGDTHQHVGAEARAELSAPVLEALGGRRGQVDGKGQDLEDQVVLDIVGLGQDPTEPGLGREMVGAVHDQEVVDDESLDLVEVVGHPLHQCLGVVGEHSPVAVADGQVFGPHDGPVGRLPEEPGLGDGRRHPPPHDCVRETGHSKDLGHLGDVAEHIGQVADVHGAAEGRTAEKAHLQVADDGLARGQEFVHQDVPRTHADPAGRGQRTQPRFDLRPYLEVVVDHGHLPVEHEVGVAVVGFEKGHQRIEHVDQIEAELLVRLVPLAVPMGVGNDNDSSGCHGHQTTTSMAAGPGRRPHRFVPAPRRSSAPGDVSHRQAEVATGSRGTVRRRRSDGG